MRSDGCRLGHEGERKGVVSALPGGENGGERNANRSGVKLVTGPKTIEPMGPIAATGGRFQA